MNYRRFLKLPRRSLHPQPGRKRTSSKTTSCHLNSGETMGRPLALIASGSQARNLTSFMQFFPRRHFLSGWERRLLPDPTHLPLLPSNGIVLAYLRQLYLWQPIPSIGIAHEMRCYRELWSNLRRAGVTWTRLWRCVRRT